MESLIGYRDLQRLDLIGDREKKATSKGLRNINVKAHMSKFSFRPIKGNVINFDKDTNIF